MVPWQQQAVAAPDEEARAAAANRLGDWNAMPMAERLGDEQGPPLAVILDAATETRFGEVVRLDPGRFLAERPANDLCCEGRDPVADASDRDERTKSHLDRLAASPGP